MLDNTTWAFVGLVLLFAVLAYYGVFGMVGRMLDKRAAEVTAELDAAQRLRSQHARVAVLDYAGALDRFRAGQTLAAQGLRTPAEQIEAAIIDSRARQVQAQLREQLANAKEKP